MNRRPTKSRSGYDSFSVRHTRFFTAAQPGNDFFEPRKKRRKKLMLLFSLLTLFAVLLIGNGVVNQFVRVSRVSVPIKGLSQAFDGFTILQISDLKGMLFGKEQSMLRRALKDAPFDAVVLTGDMLSSRENALPLYDLIDMLNEIRPSAPIYFIAGDSDPTPSSMTYAAGGSPFAPWVLGAAQRGAQLLSAPEAITRENQTLWLTTSAQLNMDIATMQKQFEQHYRTAKVSGNENEIELAQFNLNWLFATRDARKQMADNDIYVALTHVPPANDELHSSSLESPWGRIDLVLCGHYLGGLLRLPFLGPLFIPSNILPMYGILPGANTFFGLSRPGHAYLYVSPGLGGNDGFYPSAFFRLFNPPTVTLLELTMSTI